MPIQAITQDEDIKGWANKVVNTLKIQFRTTYPKIIENYINTLRYQGRIVEFIKPDYTVFMKSIEKLRMVCALQVLNKGGSNNLVYVLCYDDLGYVLLEASQQAKKEGKDLEAQTHLTEAKQIFTQLRDFDIITEEPYRHYKVETRLATIARLESQFSIADAHITKAIALFEANNNHKTRDDKWRIVDNYFEAIELQKAMGFKDEHKAMGYLKAIEDIVGRVAIPYRHYADCGLYQYYKACFYWQKWQRTHGVKDKSEAQKAVKECCDIYKHVYRDQPEHSHYQWARALQKEINSHAATHHQKPTQKGKSVKS